LRGASPKIGEARRGPLIDLRTTLFMAFGLLVLAGAAVSVFVGRRITSEAVVQEAQRRVAQDLRSAWTRYDSELERLRVVVKFVSLIQKTHDLLGSPNPDVERLRGRLEALRRQYGLDVLTVLDSRGAVVARTRPPYLSGDRPSLDDDPVLRAVFAGRPAAGTVIVSRRVLEAEGERLAEQAYLEVIETPMTTPSPRTHETSGLMLKAADPVYDDAGRVLGYVYGGILLNRNFALTDAIRDTLFRDEKFQGRPLGTVTLFQGDVRIATNVLTEEGDRAIGTRVSEAVRAVTLGRGESYHDRAFVVNDWYLTAYDPIRDPDGKVVGMLYVGVLERKFLVYQARLIRQVLVFTLVGTAVALLLGLATAAWLARPLRRVTDAARAVRGGDLSARAEPYEGPFRDLHTLNRVFNEMADALARHEADLAEANRRLAASNDELSRLNQNYMDMLEFVTHELKSPLASVLFSIGTLKDGLMGTVSDRQKMTLDAMEKNLEYQNEMILNYLNLSRIEKDELVFEPKVLALREDVIDRAIDQVRAQLDATCMTVVCDVPPDVLAWGDPDLLRIVLDNLLSNAVKYGRPGSAIRVTHELPARDRLLVKVWNAGLGISPSNLDKLFRKFSRLNVKELKAKRGTGLGLFITRAIVERHGGRIWAESQEDEWAAFVFELPSGARPEDGHGS